MIPYIDKEQQAYRRGFMDHRRGLSIDKNPYHIGTRERLGWYQGWGMREVKHKGAHNDQQARW